MHFEFAYVYFFPRDDHSLLFFLSYLEHTIKTFACIHSRSSLENHTLFQTKMGKVYTRFQTKRPKNQTLWGGTYIYGLYMGVPPPPGMSDIISVYRLKPSQRDKIAGILS